MKKSFISVLFALLLVLSSCVSRNLPREEGTETENAVSEEGEKTMRKVRNFENMKAIWLSQFDMADVYCKDGKTREKDEYETLVGRVVSDIVSLGFNTVILQIRPYGDSFYPSDVYPASRFVVGKYGENFICDPVAVFVEKAHSSGLSVQAWINPLRLMTEDEVLLLDPGCVIKKWYVEGRLPCVDNRLYLDPSVEEFRRLIIDGAAEALEKYDFDGLHIDDYFYPTLSPSFDEPSFVSSGETSLEEFRIKSVDLLVKGLYDAVKSVDSRLVFGVSPSGNLDTLKAKYCADAEKWCSSEGYVDYIMPQIYFGLEHSVCPFAETCEKWRGIVKNENVRLYVGMTLGKAVNGAKGIEDQYGGSGKREWIENNDVMGRCFEFLASSGVADGVAIFCYQYFYDPVSGNENGYSASEAASFLPYLKKDKLS